MAEVTVLVCDRCQGKRDVDSVQVQYGQERHRCDLCLKCFKEMSKMFGLSHRGSGWARTKVIDFEDIPRNTP